MVYCPWKPYCTWQSPQASFSRSHWICRQVCSLPFGEFTLIFHRSPYLFCPMPTSLFFIRYNTHSRDGYITGYNSNCVFVFESVLAFLARFSLFLTGSRFFCIQDYLHPCPHGCQKAFPLSFFICTFYLGLYECFHSEATLNREFQVSCTYKTHSCSSILIFEIFFSFN